MFMLLWQGIYLFRFFGDSVYGMVEVPVVPPNECEVPVALGEDAEGMEPGQVRFSVDMRCANVSFESVFVTTPLCGYCGPEKWNTLSDDDGDGIYEGVVTFRQGGMSGRESSRGEPLTGVGIQYRYGIKVKGESLSYPENLLPEVRQGGAYCAPVSDGMTYANRVATTDTDGTEVRSVFGTCSPVPIPTTEWEVLREAAWDDANPFLAKHVDPWWRPVSRGLARMEMVDPILFLTLCTVIYIYAIVIIGSGYVHRKEDALTAALNEAQHKNTYLEHAAKILRHDMHSGINTYIPRGIRSLERRLEKIYKEGVGSEFLDKSQRTLIEDLRLDAPLRLLKEGLAHTQKVYAGVTEFTNLVKAGAKIDRQDHDLREILTDYLDTTSYKSEVVISDLPTVSVNAPLFCTAIDNLIRNGLKYNDSPSKMVILTMVDDQHLGILDNGRGMTQEDFIEYSKPYTRKAGQKENGTGLGLNICIAILHEHGFTVTAEKRDATSGGGTLIKVKIL